MSCEFEVKLACNLAFDSYNDTSHFSYKRTKVEEENTIGYIVETDYYNILVFRGTDQVWDWVENLMVLGQKSKTVRYKESSPYRTEIKARVHSGFHKSFHRIKRHIEAILNQSPNKPWIVTGHSLGGAIASVSCLHLGLKNPMLITFGAPDWGNSDATWMVTQRTSHYLRFVNGNDFVSFIFRPLFAKPAPAIKLQSKNSRHPVKAHLEYREALGLPTDW